MSWSDYANFSSLDTLRLTAPLDGAKPLLDAVNERSSLFPYEFSLLPNIEKLEAIEIDTFRNIQNRISRLITLFVNHLNNSGNWSNTERNEIAPMWNEADILAEIGDSERIPAPVQLLELSAEWLYQQYEIINLLVWINSGVNSIDGSGVLGTATCAKYPTKPIAGDIDNAIENIYSRHWVTGAYTARADNGWGTFVAWAVNGKCKLNLGTSFGFDSNCTLYAFIGIAGDTALPNSHVYDDGGRGYLAHKWNLLESKEVLKNNEFTSAEYGAPSSEFPSYPPDLGYTNTEKGWRISGAILILKFNVPGGFEFIEEN